MPYHSNSGWTTGHKIAVGTIVTAFTAAVAVAGYFGISEAMASYQDNQHEAACRADAERLSRPDDGQMHTIPNGCYYR